MSRILISIFFGMSVTGCAPLGQALGIAEHSLIQDVAEEAIFISSGQMVDLTKEKTVRQASEEK